MVTPASVMAGKSAASTAGMRHLDGGVFKMGSQRFYPEEAPVRSVRVCLLYTSPSPRD